MAIGATIGCDRVTKHVAAITLSEAPRRSFVADTLRLDNVEIPASSCVSVRTGRSLNSVSVSKRVVPGGVDTSGLAESAVPDRRVTRSWFVQVVNNLLNPKGTLSYLGVFTTIMTPQTPPAAMVLLIVTMIAVSAVFWICFVYVLNRRALRDLKSNDLNTQRRGCWARC